MVSSSEIVAAIDRHPRTLSITPIVLGLVKRIAIPSSQAREILNNNYREEKGVPSLRSDSIRAMGTSLAPGMALDDTMAEMLSTTLRLVDFASAPTKSSELDLYAWTQSILSHASVSALYGSDSSPFQDPAVETGLW